MACESTAKTEVAANPCHNFSPQQAASWTDVRAQSTRAAISRLWFTFSSPSHSIYLAPPGQREASCLSPASPFSSTLGHCQFTSALFMNAQLRRQLALGDSTYYHLHQQIPGSTELRTTSCYSLLLNYYLLIQPRLSQNYCFPNSSSSLHNLA